MTDAIDLTIFIAREGDELVTDSRAVAIAFKKLHKNVLRSIDGMRCSAVPEIAEHARLNFEPVDFIDKNGDRRPMYRMTRDGLSELAMSFTGDQARVIRIRFLKAFKEMAARLERSEKTITEMLHDFSKRAAVSESKARIGSILMHERRREKPALKEEQAALQSLAQPSLLTH